MGGERAPHGEVRRYPVGHFDVYVEPVRSRVIADQIAFLRTHLRVPGLDAAAASRL